MEREERWEKTNADSHSCLFASACRALRSARESLGLVTSGVGSASCFCIRLLSVYPLTESGVVGGV
jgi:hypothetical protein